MNIRPMRRFVPYFVALFLALVLAGCGNTPAPTALAPSPVMNLSANATVTPGMTETPQPRVNQSTHTPRPTFDLTADFLTDPPPTGTPVVDADENVTWHPQKILISWNESPNDGNNAYTNPNFVLYWDGTLLQPSSDFGVSMAKLSQDEICKVLNTVEASGFFEETEEYQFPFAGAWGSYIGVHAWKSNWSGAQQLSSAISGASYYDMLFCRDCPIPSENTIIRPGLANTYYFLQNYLPKNRRPAEIKKWHVSFQPSEEKSNRAWPITSIPFDQFLETGMDIEGAMADEFFQKIQQDQPYPWEISADYHSVKMYAYDIWPEAPDIPPSTTLTCNTKSGHYPLLPLNKDNKFWYYAPDGKWGAERVEGQNKMRVVNTSGYEKFYQYDPAFFGQAAIQVYPHFWSADGQFFYVNVLPEPFFPNISLVNSIGLQQIDVKNEKIKYLFLSTKGETFAYELSKDGKQVAYIRQGNGPLKLVISNTYSGEEHAVSLTRPDGSLYTSAGTLIWWEHNNSIFLAANYSENGIEKTDILSTNPENLANLRILYTANAPMKLYKSFSYSDMDVCPIRAGADDNCKIEFDMETGKIQN